MDRPQRLALFISEVEQAPPAYDRATARTLVATTMNRIEDAHSGVPNDPEQWMTDGRMYPPHDDAERKSPVVGAVPFRAREHRIWFGDNGAIRIEGTGGADRNRILLDKPGADGKLCPK